jgi:hypothetical protein
MTRQPSCVARVARHGQAAEHMLRAPIYTEHTPRVLYMARVARGALAAKSTTFFGRSDAPPPCVAQVAQWGARTP